MQMTQFFSVVIKTLKLHRENLKKFATFHKNSFGYICSNLMLKTEFIILSRNFVREYERNHTNALEKEIIEEKVDCKLSRCKIRPTFINSRPIEIDLKKTSGGIKTPQPINKPLPIKTGILLINALVVSHLHNRGILLNLIAANSSSNGKNY